MLRRFAVLSCMCLWLQAAQQSPKDLLEKASPDVDDALRARIEKFFRTFVDGKYRDAYETVAEDSKDTFLGSDKYKCTKVEIAKIAYSENFTRATALVACDGEFGAGMKRFATKIPITSLWKLEDGKWWWYTLPKGEMDSPFGVLRRGNEPGGQPAAPVVPKIPDLSEIMNMLRLDKYQVRLSSYEAATDEVIVTNDMPGEVALSLEYTPPPGMSAKLDRTSLKPHEKARITFACKPPDKAPKPSMDVRLKVDPLGARIAIHVIFAIPPELEKQIPK